jgi:hypothetical protein
MRRNTQYFSFLQVKLSIRGRVPLPLKKCVSVCLGVTSVWRLKEKWMVVSEHFLFPFSNLAVFSCHARHFSPDVLLCFSSSVAHPCHFELFPYGNLLDYKSRSFFVSACLLSRTEKFCTTLVIAYTHCNFTSTLHLVLNFMCFIPFFFVILIYRRSWTIRL